MKIYTMLVSVLVLTAMLMTGCGCRNNKPLDTMPSENTTAATTAPTTEATTAPTTAPTTMPTTEATDATIDNGNGPLPTDNAAENDTVGDNARGRRMPGME